MEKGGSRMACEVKEGMIEGAIHVNTQSVERSNSSKSILLYNKGLNM